jgi:hypothetical protein
MGTAGEQPQISVDLAPQAVGRRLEGLLQVTSEAYDLLAQLEEPVYHVDRVAGRVMPDVDVLRPASVERAGGGLLSVMSRVEWRPPVLGSVPDLASPTPLPGGVDIVFALTLQAQRGGEIQTLSALRATDCTPDGFSTGTQVEPGSSLLDGLVTRPPATVPEFVGFLDVEREVKGYLGEIVRHPRVVDALPREAGELALQVDAGAVSAWPAQA